MGKIILYIVSIGLILLIGSAIYPYWNRFLITSDLEEAALYCTKHSIADTQRLLSDKIEQRGYIFDPENLYIEKDEDKTVTIGLTYNDKISFFGIVLKELEFSLDVTERYINEVF
jgi:hypothetical protein